MADVSAAEMTDVQSQELIRRQNEEIRALRARCSAQSEEISQLTAVRCHQDERLQEGRCQYQYLLPTHRQLQEHARALEDGHRRLLDWGRYLDDHVRELVHKNRTLEQRLEESRGHYKYLIHKHQQLLDTTEVKVMADNAGLDPVSEETVKQPHGEIHSGDNDNHMSQGSVTQESTQDDLTTYVTSESSPVTSKVQLTRSCSSTRPGIGEDGPAHNPALSETNSSRILSEPLSGESDVTSSTAEVRLHRHLTFFDEHCQTLQSTTPACTVPGDDNLKSLDNLSDASGDSGYDSSESPFSPMIMYESEV